jgi:HPt (histidine-containing phosphotransfer) domain-containing protein
MGITVQLLDFNRHVALDRVGGDEVLLHEVVQLFLHEYPALLEHVAHAVEKSNTGLLERSAHSLKGSLSTIGAEVAAQTALSLELMGRSGRIDGAAVQFAHLRSAIERLTRELQEIRMN